MDRNVRLDAWTAVPRLLSSTSYSPNCIMRIDGVHTACEPGPVPSLGLLSDAFNPNGWHASRSGDIAGDILRRRSAYSEQ